MVTEKTGVASSTSVACSCSSHRTSFRTKIVWVLSYMKSGRAATFSDRTLRWESDHSGQPRFPSFDHFHAHLVSEFCKQHEDIHARNRLETTDYYQGRRSVDEYIDEFEDLVDRAGYDASIDSSNVMRFRCGLSVEIQDCIAELGANRPKETDLAGWVAHARLFAQNREANTAFKGGARFSPSAPKATSVAPRRLFPTFLTTSPSAPPAVRPLPMGVPMDVDAARQRGSTPVICHRCHKPGHMKTSCPSHFDIRALTAAELLDLAALVSEGSQVEEALEFVVEKVSDDPPIAQESPDDGEPAVETAQDFSEGRA
ncbi:hypothetical protein HGRIS_014909 [Hohenbuehelia grisea]|uniref:CCHC-type domain-containing protein n=1 Tax=Hohenbuehelia grisea TaxID=104357 RepID=A0ABR3JHZ8_9AGAR